MDIKITKKPTGIPQAEVVCAHGVAPHGAEQVTMFLRAIDAHQIVEGVGRVVMTKQEALDLAARLVRAAEGSS